MCFVVGLSPRIPPTQLILILCQPLGLTMIIIAVAIIYKHSARISNDDSIPRIGQKAAQRTRSEVRSRRFQSLTQILRQCHPSVISKDSSCKDSWQIRKSEAKILHQNSKTEYDCLSTSYKNVLALKADV